MKDVTIAILARNKSVTLPYYLKCIEDQTISKENIHIYVRTNDNTDNTADILNEWINRNYKSYKSIHFDSSDSNINMPEGHEWNYDRFIFLGSVRQESINFAIKNNSHYFVCDCDNFIKPHTISTLMDVNLPVVAPMLYTSCAYSNFHETIDKNGYYLPSDMYFKILNRNVVGLISVPVVHCSYFIRNDVLPAICYDDKSYRYEYVIFSDVLRKNNILQYLDNRECYGYITFATSNDSLFKESWIGNDWIKNIIQPIL